MAMSVFTIMVAGHDAKVAARSTLVVGVEADANSLEAARTMGIHNDRMVLQIFDTLLMLEGESSELKPGLATSWKISDDGLRYTFDLRRDVRFHDGTDFNADAVVFTFERMLNKDHPYHNVVFPWANYYFGNVAKVEAEGPYRVTFTLKEPQATFLTYMKHISGGIVSPSAVKKFGAAFGESPVGTGPFKYVGWDRGQRVRLAANEDYWRGAPKVDELIFKPVSDPTARLNQLRSGEIDVMVAFPPEFIPQIEQDDQLKLYLQTGAHTWWVTLNTKSGPFANKKVRQAANHAIDRKAIIDEVLYGAGTLSTSFATPGSKWYEEDVQTYPYDPDKARVLLAEAGYPDGFETEFMVPQSGSGMIAPVQIATVMQAYLQAVGIKVELVTQEWNSYLDTYQAGLEAAKAGMAEMSWMRDTSDPALYTGTNLMCSHRPPNGFNTGGYCNKTFDKIYAKASLITDQEERIDLYRQAQELIAEDAPWIFMFHAKQAVAAQKGVAGIVLNPSFLIRFENVSMQPDG